MNTQRYSRLSTQRLELIAASSPVIAGAIYMPIDELESEIAAGVVFSGYDVDGQLVGVMGIQHVRDVDLIRHAYVLPGSQHHGVGSALLRHLQNTSTRPILVGTWAAAEWAIRFYERHG